MSTLPTLDEDGIWHPKIALPFSSSSIGWRVLWWEQWNHISSLPTLHEDEIQHPEETPLHWVEIPILFSSPYIGWRFLFFSALPILDEDSSQEVLNITLWWMHHKINSTSHSHWRTHLHNMCSWQVFTTQHSIALCSSLSHPCGSWCSKAIGPCIPASVAAMLPGQCLQNAPLALLRFRLLFCHRYLRSFHCCFDLWVCIIATIAQSFWVVSSLVSTIVKIYITTLKSSQLSSPAC